ncbi:MAG: GntR family transcriptional regulator [Granulosicoccus sp.]|nr:GntR family transcriptional regulator [Granulosicoccus sp.]
MKIGYTSQAPVIERNQNTVSLDCGALGCLTVPVAEAEHAAPGDSLSVFIHTDAQGNPLASAVKPYVQRDECASLKVVDVSNAGVFLDWGLSKNLLLPYAEQRRPLKVDQYECVLVYLDNSGRLAASSRLDHHLPDTASDYRPWQQVNLLIFQRTSLGLKAVVEHRHVGLLYKDEIFTNVRLGQTHQGYVKRLRHDGRIDLSLQPPSKQLQPELTDRVLAYLHENKGKCKLSDHSTPEEIQAVFQVSKKNFKRAISSLYKQRRITIETDHIILNEDQKQSDSS